MNRTHTLRWNETIPLYGGYKYDLLERMRYDKTTNVAHAHDLQVKALQNVDEIVSTKVRTRYVTVFRPYNTARILVCFEPG